MTPAQQLEAVERALDEAKHVRRRSTLLVKMLGSLAEQLKEQDVDTPEGHDDVGADREHVYTA